MSGWYYCVERRTNHLDLRHHPEDVAVVDAIRPQVQGLLPLGRSPLVPPVESLNEIDQSTFWSVVAIAMKLTLMTRYEPDIEH